MPCCPTTSQTSALPASWWCWTPIEAEQLGAFEETALTEAEAWESNLDLDADEASHGG